MEKEIFTHNEVVAEPAEMLADLQHELEKNIELWGREPILKIVGGPSVVSQSVRYEWTDDPTSPFIHIMINGAQKRVKVAPFLAGKSYDLDFDGLIYTTTIQRTSTGDVEVTMTFQTEQSVIPDNAFEHRDSLPVGVEDLRGLGLRMADGTPIRGYRRQIAGLDEQRFPAELKWLPEKRYFVLAYYVSGRKIDEKTNFVPATFQPGVAQQRQRNGKLITQTCFVDSDGILQVKIEFPPAQTMTLSPPITINTITKKYLAVELADPTGTLRGIEARRSPGEKVVHIVKAGWPLMSDEAWFDIPFSDIASGKLTLTRGGKTYFIYQDPATASSETLRLIIEPRLSVIPGTHDVDPELIFKGTPFKAVSKRVLGLPGDLAGKVTTQRDQERERIRLYEPGNFMNTKWFDVVLSKLDTTYLSYGKNGRMFHIYGTVHDGILFMHMEETTKEEAAPEEIERVVIPGWQLPYNPNDFLQIVSEFKSSHRPNHMGIDIDMLGGKPIKAVGSGVVSKIEYDADGYGHYLIIDHGNGLKTLYAHMKNKPSVKKNEKVVAGQEIGYVGKTGRVIPGPGGDGTHLHFEVHKDGVPVNPRNYFNFRSKIVDQTPPSVETFSQAGKASVYAPRFHGRQTRYNERYDHYANPPTAAHNTLPHNTRVKVTRKDDPSKSVVVRINDTGKLGPGCIIDLNGFAAEKIGLTKNYKVTEGVTDVIIEVLK